MGTPIAKPESAYHHGNLRKALVDAALELIGKGDPGELSLRAVARRAGVSTAAPYRHFESRDALLAAVAEEGYGGLAASIRAASEAHIDDPMARFREAGVGYVMFAHANPAHYAVMCRPELVDKSAYPELTAAATEAMGLLMDAISACQRAGFIPDGDPREIALAAWSSVHGLASLISSGQIGVLGFDTDDVEDVARRMAKSLLSGVGTQR
jgi:AcrR family transcriptional regulator